MLIKWGFSYSFRKIKVLNLESKDDEYEEIEETEEMVGIYLKQLSNLELEYSYIGMLLNNPKLIVKYYFLDKECYFEDENILNIYKSVLFTEGGNYTPEIAKKGFNFAQDTEKAYELKKELKQRFETEEYKIEQVYQELKKLFVLRKNYLETPLKETQQSIVDIIEYKLYKEMSVEEVYSAIRQTDHTNDELRKVIMNYYYKEKIEYIFYDTLKTDTANIGVAEELKKTATILSNLAQNFNIFICSTF